MSMWDLRLFACGLVFSAATFLGVACGSESSDTPGAAGSSAGTGSVSSCTAGTQCNCSDGRLGQTRCEDAAMTCSCDGCPPLLNQGQPAFTACGGWPVGRWHSRTATAGTIDARVWSPDHSASTTCPSESRSIDAYDLRLELFEVGRAEMAFSADTTYDALLSCLSGLSGAYTCEEARPVAPVLYQYQADTSCSTQACGMCSCAQISGGGIIAGSWSRTDTSLTIGWPDDQYPGTFDYCVEGDTMTLRTASGVVVELDRTFVTGTPKPCSSRTTQECTIGDGCSLGACVGGTTCTSLAESNCSTVQGCSWSTDLCRGNAPLTCQMVDYDVVPGCTFVTGTASCVGTPSSCTSQTASDCWNLPGCNPTPGCIGGALSCSKWNGACSVCDSKVGCSCTSTGLCQGSTTCEAQDRYECDTDSTGCTWVECTGTATPCEELEELLCDTASGCHLEVIPSSP